MDMSEIIKGHLREAVKQCSIRGLFLASGWSSEQLIGMQTDSVPSQELSEMDTDRFSAAATTDVYNINEEIPNWEMDLINFANTLLINGEYQRCSHVLGWNKQGNSISKMSNLRLFLAAYSSFLAGKNLQSQLDEENLKPKKSAPGKEQNPSKAPTKKPTKKPVDFRELLKSNNYIAQIYKVLLPLYSAGKMDGFLLYLFAVVVRDTHSEYGVPLETVLSDIYAGGASKDGLLSVKQLFVEALHLYPWNWSCWLELGQFCATDKTKLPTWEEIRDCQCSWEKTQNISNMEVSNSPAQLTPKPGNSSQETESQSDDVKESAKIMFACFLTHVYLERHRGDLALQILDGTMQLLPTSLVILCQIGMAHYSQRQYESAQTAFEVARRRDPYRLQNLDTYSNILYVKESLPELSILAHEAIKINKYTPEVCSVVGNYYSLKGQHERAIIYFQRALRLNPDCLSAWTLMGHEYMELRNTAAAVHCYRSAVKISDLDYRAWYGLGQTYEMLHLYQYACYYFRKAAFLRPSDARMWCAVGNCLLKLNLREETILTYQRAVSCGDREGIATRDLARLYREDGRGEQAARCYTQYLTICGTFESKRNNNMSSSNIQNVTDSSPFNSKFNRSLMSTEEEDEGDDSMLTGIIGSSSLQRGVGPEEAEALLFLASHYRNTADWAQAELCCSRLLSYVGPEGDEARALLRELRQRIHMQT